MSTEKSDAMDHPKKGLGGALSRRHMLLAGTSALAAAGVAGGASLAQAQPAPTPRPASQEAEHPRHLRRRHRLLEHQRLQPRHDGLPHAEHRPHRQGRRDVHRPLRAAVLHRRARRLHHRAVLLPHRPAQGRPAGRQGRTVRKGPDARRPAQATRLCDRPVRQEPSRRPQRVPADRARLRRVLRQPLPPQRGGGAREPGLSQGPRVPRQVRPARRAEVQGDRPGRSHGGPALRPRRQADHRGHRPAHARSAWRRWTKSSSAARSTSSTVSTRPASRSSAGSTRPACTSTRTSSRNRRARPAWASWPTA